jgi:hypothetical protein
MKVHKYEYRYKYRCMGWLGSDTDTGTEEEGAGAEAQVHGNPRAEARSGGRCVLCHSANRSVSAPSVSV